MTVVLSTMERYGDLRSVVAKTLQEGAGEVVFQVGDYFVLAGVSGMETYFALYSGDECLHRDAVDVSNLYSLLADIVDVYGSGVSVEEFFYVRHESYEDLQEAFERALDYAGRGYAVKLAAYLFVYLEVVLNAFALEVVYRNNTLSVAVPYVDWSKEENRQLVEYILTRALDLAGSCNSFHIVQEGDEVRIVECDCLPEVMERLRLIFS